MREIGPGTVVFVTGGASGLGEATVRLLDQKGALIAIADRDIDLTEEISNSLISKRRPLCIECDVTSEEQVAAAIAATVAKFGRLDAAIACAGVGMIDQTMTARGAISLSTFATVMSINVFGSLHVAKHAALAMAKNEGDSKGVIIFVSSIAAEEGSKGQVAYGASKGALNGMVMPMARDLGKYGIRVAAIAPGIFATPMRETLPPKA